MELKTALSTVLLLLLFTLSSALTWPWQHQPLKIYVYDMNKFYGGKVFPCVNTWCCTFTNRLLRSKYFTSDGDAADYYYIPLVASIQNASYAAKMFNHIKMNYPWWNRTAAAGQVRHIMMLQSDKGPTDSGFHDMDKGIYMGNPHLPDEFNPASPNRKVAFFMLNGKRDGSDMGNKECGTCFQIGKDIMYPTPQNICGPLCGYNLTVLRQHAIWNSTHARLQQDLHKPRTNTLFYGGTIGTPETWDSTGRGGIYKNYVNKTGYLIARAGESKRVSFAETMRESDWCFAPLGHHGGDPDRYGAGIMFGCLPVMLNSSEYEEPGVRRAIPNALPLEEILPWHLFGTVIDVTHLDRLDAQLKCLAPRISKMRAVLAAVWRHFLYTSVYGSYLGEDDAHDAFEGLMSVLKQRARHNYTLSPLTWQRLRHREQFFPCLACNTTATCGEPSPNVSAAAVSWYAKHEQWLKAAWGHALGGHAAASHSAWLH